MEMDQPLVAPNQFGDRRARSNIALSVQVQAAVRRTDLSTSSSTSAAVVTKLVVLRARGARKASITSSVFASTGRLTSENNRWHSSRPSYRLTPGGKFRCGGEPKTMTRPPRSPKRASSPRYWAVCVAPLRRGWSNENPRS